MRIGIYIDGQFKKMTGIQHYTDSLIGGLYALESPHEIVAFASGIPNPDYIEQIAEEQKGTFQWRSSPRCRFDIGNVRRSYVPIPFQERHPWFSKQLQIREERYLRPRHLGDTQRAKNYDLFHVPEPHDLSFLRYTPRRAVATMHDLAWKFCSWAYEPAAAAVWDRYLKFAKERCTRILSVSESTKRDVIEYAGIPADRIDVTPLAARESAYRMEDGPTRRMLLKEWDIASEVPFVLYAGTLEPRKNLERLVKAFAYVVKQEPTIEHKLVLAGGNWFRHDLELRILACELGIGGRVITTGYVSNDQMNALMSACDVFAYVSLYEGFGLPPLEAMTCGAPVITSDKASMPEVVGNAGFLVNPEDVPEIAGGLHHLIMNREENRRRRNLSLERSKEFSWERTARTTLQAYEKAAAE